jgi:hypothetical protein
MFGFFVFFFSYFFKISQKIELKTKKQKILGNERSKKAPDSPDPNKKSSLSFFLKTKADRLKRTQHVLREW